MGSLRRARLSVGQQLSDHLLRNYPERVLGALPMRAGFFGIFDQKLVEVRIGVDDGQRLRRAWKCNFILGGAENNITTQESLQFG